MSMRASTTRYASLWHAAKCAFGQTVNLPHHSSPHSLAMDSCMSLIFLLMTSPTLVMMVPSFARHSWSKDENCNLEELTLTYNYLNSQLTSTVQRKQ